MRRKKPEIGDVVKSRTLPACDAGFIVGTQGIHVWVRFFDHADKEYSDVYARRDTLEVVSRANPR